MSWDAIGAVAELLGALGVIASLGYLAIQIRQNTTAMRGTTHEVAVEHLSTVMLALSSDAELADIVLRGSRDFSSLSHGERLRFGSYWQSSLIGAEGSLLQFHRGNLDEAVWLRDFSVLQPWLATPGFQAWWERNRVVFTPEFAATIQREIDAARVEGGESETPSERPF